MVSDESTIRLSYVSDEYPSYQKDIVSNTPRLRHTIERYQISVLRHLSFFTGANIEIVSPNNNHRLSTEICNAIHQKYSIDAVLHAIKSNFNNDYYAYTNSFPHAELLHSTQAIEIGDNVGYGVMHQPSLFDHQYTVSGLRGIPKNLDDTTRRAALNNYAVSNHLSTDVVKYHFCPRNRDTPQVHDRHTIWLRVLRVSVKNNKDVTLSARRGLRWRELNE